ncbi:unnamed protein product, partial [Sphagnum balticum]
FDHSPDSPNIPHHPEFDNHHQSHERSPSPPAHEIDYEDERFMQQQRVSPLTEHAPPPHHLNAHDMDEFDPIHHRRDVPLTPTPPPSPLPSPPAAVAPPPPVAVAPPPPKATARPTATAPTSGTSGQCGSIPATLLPTDTVILMCQLPDLLSWARMKPKGENDSDACPATVLVPSVLHVPL